MEEEPECHSCSSFEVPPLLRKALRTTHCPCHLLWAGHLASWNVHFLTWQSEEVGLQENFQRMFPGSPGATSGGRWEGGGGMLREAVATSVSWHVFVWSKEFYREKSTWKSLFMVISKGLSVLYFSPASLFLLICWLPFGSKLEVLATSPTGVQEIANTTFFMAILLPGHWGCVPGAIDHFHKVW